MYINRGNHEAKEMNRTYGFEGEAKHKHGDQSYKVSDQLCYRISCILRQAHSFLLTYLRHVSWMIRSSEQKLIISAVPLATLISATKAPVQPVKPSAILSPEGYLRYFVVHGGLFSKDEVTLDDIEKIDRIGRQPGQEGLMCESPLSML